MTYLILGANGQIGQYFVHVCKEKGIDYVGTRYSRDAEGLLPFNQLDLDKIPFFFEETSPTVVVNCTGLAGGVNFCQENPRIGRLYHVDSTKAMVNWIQKTDAVFVYISTDYVFDGKNPPYREENDPNPLNFYGRFKLEGERYIQENLRRFVIARTSNVFSWDPGTKTPNFLMQLIKTFTEKNSIEVPGYLYGDPTYAGDLVAGIWDLVESQNYGLYHIVGSENINRYDWASKLLDAAGLYGKSLKKVQTPPMDMVPRPLCSHLDTGKFKKVSDVKLHNVDEGLRLFVNDMNNPQKYV